MSTQKRRGGYLATAKGVRKLKEAKRIKKYTYQKIAAAANETEDKVKRLFNPQWGNGTYKVGEQAVEAICDVLDLRPEEIVRDWYPVEITLDQTNILTSAPAKKHDPSYDKALKKIEQAAKEQEGVLDLSRMELTELPPEIGQISNLEGLDLSNNSLSSLPPEIGQISNLTALYLSNNSLSSLPPEIGQLSNLTELYLLNNSLSSLPPEIVQLSNLTILDLNNNFLSSLPPEIIQLSNLTILDLNNNFLSSLPPGIVRLSNLTELFLSNNSLSNLPPEISQLFNLRHLSVSNNSLPIPPEIIKEKYASIIINYYFSLQKDQKQPLHEAKMLLVGQGNVGKTCLRERLIRNQYDPTRNKTDGIDIENWKIEIEDKELQVNIWDFGGQEIMHSTHQFFLTERSLYLLIVDTTQSEEENRIEYWLKIIQSFGKDAPVILVGNKADQHPFDIDKNGLKKKYSQIKDFFEISCETGEGIPELAEFVKQEINQLEHIDDLLPLPWFNIKQKLEKIDKDYIPYEEYESLCEEEKVEEEQKQRILIRLLNDLGIVLNFQDDPRLEDTHVLNPEWVTNGVYKILNDRGLIVDNRGILTLTILKRILYQINKRRYPVRKHLFIIGMMRKFELCFEMETDKQWLIPDILPKEEPYTGEWDNTLTFEYHYPVLPGSIISRFIVRMNHYIHQKTYWRSGVVLAHEGNTALVKADREDKIIEIRVKGNINTRRNLLTAIRSQFDYIHSTIPRIKAEQKVQVPGYPEIPPVDYEWLLDLEKKNKPSFIPPGLTDEINLREVLKGIESETIRRSKNRDPYINQ
ncbi:small GTP-binding protein domain protein [Xenococcus sp. PCC 7305]|uniref:COR domain-containing protein n=1 Tax=Xenococcus sp. PCC 7305 TaxID=102125 RepID=UPI0002ACE87A|nr:COR domain-containing protein [Xenococcus sp. PCC 7305]ELS00329.1 small GTP-binding protein domain protein [Xenococcus sp. PCC 7305]